VGQAQMVRCQVVEILEEDGGAGRRAGKDGQLEVGRRCFDPVEQRIVNKSCGVHPHL
jgi:hypothetical protein